MRFLTSIVLVGVLMAAACGGGDASPSATRPTIASTTTAVPATTSASSTTTSTVAPSTTTTTSSTTTSTVAPSTTTTTSSTTTSTVPPSTTISAEVLARYDFSAVGPIVQGFVDQNGLNGAGLVIVEKDDGIVHHQHWGDFDQDRISFIASSSKMVSAGVLMHLHDQGLLDVDAPVADVAAWGRGNPTVTPAQLLSNSSGLVGLADIGYGPYLCQFVATGSLQDCAESVFMTTEDDADVARPDTEFRYGGVQWQVAGAVAEVASGRSWAELIDEIYVEPCGLQTFGFNNHYLQLTSLLSLLFFGITYPIGFDGDLGLLAPTANPNIEGGAYSTTRDYAQLLLMHLRGGRCGENQVLSPASVARMHADRIGSVYGGRTQYGKGYGLGWLTHPGTNRITDGGLYGSHPWLVPSEGYGAYLVLEATSDHGNALAGRLYDVVGAAVRAGRN